MFHISLPQAWWRCSCWLGLGRGARVPTAVVLPGAFFTFHFPERGGTVLVGLGFAACMLLQVCMAHAFPLHFLKRGGAVLAGLCFKSGWLCACCCMFAWHIFHPSVPQTWWHCSRWVVFCCVRAVCVLLRACCCRFAWRTFSPFTSSNGHHVYLATPGCVPGTPGRAH